jgi:hypothetical protein
MRRLFILATVRAEFHRAARDRRPVDRDFLLRETGAHHAKLDRIIEEFQSGSVHPLPSRAGPDGDVVDGGTAPDPRAPEQPSTASPILQRRSA